MKLVLGFEHESGKLSHYRCGKTQLSLSLYLIINVINNIHRFLQLRLLHSDYQLLDER